MPNITEGEEEEEGGRKNNLFSFGYIFGKGGLAAFLRCQEVGMFVYGELVFQLSSPPSVTGFNSGRDGG